MASMVMGSGFSEYSLLPAKTATPVPAVVPDVVALLTSGLTASIGDHQNILLCMFLLVDGEGSKSSQPGLFGHFAPRGIRCKRCHARTP